MLLGRHTSVITVLTCPSTKQWQSCCEQTVTVREFLSTSERWDHGGDGQHYSGAAVLLWGIKAAVGSTAQGSEGKEGGGGGSQGRGLQIPSAEMTESESERAQVHHTHWT